MSKYFEIVMNSFIMGRNILCFELSLMFLMIMCSKKYSYYLGYCPYTFYIINLSSGIRDDIFLPTYVDPLERASLIHWTLRAFLSATYILLMSTIISGRKKKIPVKITIETEIACVLVYKSSVTVMKCKMPL
jgi:hypothetical protein